MYDYLETYSNGDMTGKNDKTVSFYVKSSKIGRAM